MPSLSSRRLIINADDFGRDAGVNEAVSEACERGILTTASLMVNESAAADAVRIAKERPHLGIGLHLTLVCGHGAQTHSQAPHLVDEQQNFSNNAPRAGILYFFNRAAREELRREIEAQIKLFRQTGLPLDHVNGHLHLHLHPIVADILLDHAQEWGIKHLRWSRDLFWLSWKLGKGPLFYRVSHAVIFNLLTRRIKRKLQTLNIKCTSRVFGLMQTSHVNEEYLLKMLEHLPAGDSEVYSHPSIEEHSRAEYLALISEKIAQKIRTSSISLIRYTDL